jgi:hypothetical protein
MLYRTAVEHEISVVVFHGHHEVSSAGRDISVQSWRLAVLSQDPIHALHDNVQPRHYEPSCLRTFVLSVNNAAGSMCVRCNAHTYLHLAARNCLVQIRLVSAL